MKQAFMSTLGLVAAIAAIPLASAHAQNASENTPAYLASSVGDLLAPGSRRYSPGIRMGSFLVQPELTTSVVHDDNVFASPRKRDDTHANVDARVGTYSNWSRHAVEFYVGGGGNFYDEFTSENTGYANAGIAGRLDIQSGFYVKTFGNYAYGFESRGSGESFQNFLEPVKTQALSSGVLAHKHFNRLWAELGATVNDNEYFDARTSIGKVDQSFRNGTAYEVSGRVGYEYSPKTSVFAEFGYDWRDYEDNRVDADGFRAGVGVRYEITRITSAEAAIGYRGYDPSQNGFDNISSWYYRAQLAWDATPLMRFSLAGTRDIGSPSQDGTGSNRINSDIGVRVDYAFRRDIGLNAGVGYGNVDYVDSGRNDDYYRVAVGGDYLFRPWLAVFANYSYYDYNSDTSPSIDYTKNVVTVGFKASY